VRKLVIGSRGLLDGWVKPSTGTKPQAPEIGVGVVSNHFEINGEKGTRAKTKTVM
jgi:hypothetical protein